MPSILTPEVATVLNASTITGNHLQLPNETLDRKLYQKVNEHLVNCGGRWDKKLRVHVFPADPTEAIGLVLTTGKSVNTPKEHKKLRQAFYTPADVAKEVAIYSDVVGKTVLEPSAGGGALADACREWGAQVVHCIEIDLQAVEELRERYAPVCADFLTLEIPDNDVLRYDRVVMNPPFTKGQYHIHIARALRWLKSDGLLTAIVPDQDCPKLTALGAETLVQYPAGTFKESGTQIATRLIRLHAPTLINSLTKSSPMSTKTPPKKATKPAVKKPSAKAGPATAGRQKTVAKPAPEPTTYAPPPPPIEEGIRQKINPSLIDPHPHNRVIDPQTCQGLAASMKSHGQIQPATVRPHPTKPGRYQLGAGARRWHAATLAGLELDCIIRNLSDPEIEAMLVIENHQRANPDPRHEATQIRRMFEAHPDANADDIAALMGQSLTWARRRMRLLSLTEDMLKAWSHPHFNLVTVSTMELVANLPPAQQQELIINFKDSWKKPTDASIQEWMNRQACSLKGVSWLDDERTFIPGCGPGCASSSAAKDLFSSTEFADNKTLQCATCLNTVCFNKRREKARLIAWEEAIAKAPEGFLAASRTYQKETLELPNKTKITLQDRYQFQDWKAAKKTDPKAVPILTESDAGNVTVTWKLKPANLSAQKNAQLAPAAKTEAQSRAASIERLQARRYDHVLGQLREHFTKAPNPFPHGTHRLIAFAAVFGTDTRELQANPKNWEQFTNLASTEPETIHTALWDQVHGVIERRLQDPQFTYRKSDLLQKDFQHELKAVAALTSFDLTAAYATAAAACPAPKSLGPTDPITLKPKK